MNYYQFCDCLIIPILFLFYCKDRKTSEPQPDSSNWGSIPLSPNCYRLIILNTVLAAACAQVQLSLDVTLTVC